MGPTARRLTGRLTALAGGLVALALLAAPVLGAQSFVVSAYPTELVADATTSITITVTNTGSGKNSDISCVQFAVRSTFKVVAAAIVSVHGARSGAAFDAWDVVWPGASRVTFKDPQADYPLVGGQPGADQAVFRIRGYATGTGQLSWAVGAHDVPDTSSTTTCSGTSSSGSLSFVVVDAAPTPTASPRPTPTPTPTTKPTPRPTPSPTRTPSPVPTASPAPSHTAQPSPTPTATAVPPSPPPPGSPPRDRPTPLPTERPSPPPTVQPTSESTPPATHSPQLVLGTGSDHTGNGQPQQLASGLDGAVSNALQALPGGALAWTYPALITAVPGILVLLAIAAQMLGALAWIPIVRRSLSGIGVARRRRYRPGDNAH